MPGEHVKYRKRRRAAAVTDLPRRLWLDDPLVWTADQRRRALARTSRYLESLLNQRTAVNARIRAARRRLNGLRDVALT